jgi:hypothetical protein
VNPSFRRAKQDIDLAKFALERAITAMDGDNFGEAIDELEAASRYATEGRKTIEAALNTVS